MSEQRFQLAPDDAIPEVERQRFRIAFLEDVVGELAAMESDEFRQECLNGSGQCCLCGGTSLSNGKEPEHYDTCIWVRAKYLMDK